MALTRRHLLTLLASASVLPLVHAKAEAAPEVYTHLPHAPPQLQNGSGRNLVLALWHYFPISFDNKPVQFDYYTRQLLTVDGEARKHSSYGGFLRDRPLPIKPIATKRWRIELASRDIKFAQDAGLDGFLFNISSIAPKDGYLQNCEALLSAIAETGSSFGVAPCIDAVAIPGSESTTAIVEAIRPLLQRQGALRSQDGRVILGAFAAENWDTSRWQAILEALTEDGERVYFSPIFLNPSTVSDQHISFADSVGWWSGDHPAAVLDMAEKRETARGQGKSFMWSVWPQDNRPKGQWYTETRNSEVFRTSWEMAISNESEMIVVLTWNDYAEGSHIRPSEGIRYSFADLNRYYSDWFKSRRTPAIARDMIFYFHRRDFTGQDHAGDQQQRAMKQAQGTGPADDFEVVCFLLSAGELEMTSGPRTQSYLATAGLSAFRIPLRSGSQSARLLRGGKQVLAITSPWLVRERWDWQDLTYRGDSTGRL